MIPQAELNRWKQLCAKATEGPWRREDLSVMAGRDVIASNGRGGTDREWIEKGDRNMDFISAARTALPRLIAEVEEARKILSDHCRCAEDWPVDGAAPTSAFDIYERAHRFLGEEEK